MFENFQGRLGTKIFHRILKGLIWLVFISLLIGLLRQISLQRSISQRIEQRQKELVQLEQRNEELKAKLQDTQNPEFLDNQLKKMLGLSVDEGKEKFENTPDLRLKEEIIVPVYKQWISLFVY